MKQRFITITALAVIIALAGCQRESEMPVARSIRVQLEDAVTKVDVAANTGVCTWTEGDVIGLYVTESGSGSYIEVPVNAASSTVTPTLSVTQSVGGYAVSPYIMRGNGTTPTVVYLQSYSMEGLDLSAQTFSFVPMMARGDDEVLHFYQVGGLLRLVLKNVPDGTNKIRVTFNGITNVTGTATVSDAGTAQASATLTSGTGNVVTFTDVTPTAAPGKTYLNIPLPLQDYSAMSSLCVEAMNGSTVLSAYDKVLSYSWGVLKHGWGRVYALDFADALSGVRLSSEADITLWKSNTVQRTAVAVDAYGLDNDVVPMVWSSSDETVATVDASTGEVTAVGPGSATITATATPATGGTSYSNSYDVYVNTFSVASVVATTSTIGPGATTSVTATLTHTNNGTIPTFPADLSVAWTSSATTYVTVSSPSSVDVSSLQSVTTATGGTVGSSSTITASVPNYGTSTANCSITCKLVADLTFPSGGEKYKFRGYYMHPGSLYWNGSSFSITDGTDPLEIVTHFATEGAPPSGPNRFYLTWTELSSLGTANGVITGTVHANDAATGNHDWKIPTLTSSSAGELAIILSNAPSYPIRINSTSEVGDNTRNYLYVNVKLPTTGTYANKGLGYAGSYSGSSAGNKAYQAGMLLVPDGAHLTCPGMDSSSGHGDSNSTTASTVYNVIDYEDLLILVDKGCVFLPDAGYYFDGWYYLGGEYGFYWSASQYNDSMANELHFVHNNGFNVYYYGKSSLYFPVRVVR